MVASLQDSGGAQVPVGETLEVPCHQSPLGGHHVSDGFLRGRAEPLQLGPVVEQEPDCEPLGEIELLPLRPPTLLLAWMERERLDEGSVRHGPEEGERKRESRESGALKVEEKGG